jgi:HK97 family phage portal protein
MKSIFAGVFGPTQPASSDDHWIVRAFGRRTSSGVTVSEYSALNLPVVYACVNRISNPIAMFPLQVFRAGADGEAVEDRAHRLNAILRSRPNPFMNTRDLKKTGQVHACLWGNAYQEIQRNNAGEAIALWPLLPWSTSPDKSTDQLRFQTVIDGKTFTLPAQDVVHVMDVSLDGYCGLSPIQQARSAVGLAQAAETYGEKFFANDARSGGFLQHPGKLSAKAKTNIAEDIEEKTGLDNAHRIKVLEEGMKFVATTIPPDDAQFLSTREFQIGEIARMYNVPLFLLQHSEPGTVWGSGMEQMMIAFVVHTLEPWTTAWESEYNLKLFSEAERAEGYFVKFNMAALLRGDMKARAEFYASGIQNGWMTRAYARSKEDMPVIDGLDEPLVPVNMQGINQQGNSDADV